MRTKLRIDETERFKGIIRIKQQNNPIERFNKDSTIYLNKKKREMSKFFY